MSAAHVLQEDWRDYDDRKIRDRRDSKDFACTEQWEVDYLVGKILKTHPGVSDAAARQAITDCCKRVGAPHPRPAFVECVMKGLGY